jgi:hypothetical protein
MDRTRAWFGGAALVVALAMGGHVALAGVSAEEAQKLKSELTPMGAERAGNAEKTIPPWEGGYREVWPGYRSGQPRPDPFAGERPVLQITAANMDRYADKLSEGTRALLQRFPGYRLDVYPTHRTAAAPAYVYENTFRNATRARSTSNGLVIENVFGGVPFPIPKTGAEAMWNHLLDWRGEALSYEFTTFVVTRNRPVMTTAGVLDIDSPYFRPDGSPDDFEGFVARVKFKTTAPPFRVGESFIVHDPIDQKNRTRRAWQYLVGQRRVRRTPIFSYDNPDPLTSGVTFFDEAFLFNGALDRYDWKLVGKQEMFIPYNTHRLHTRKVAEVLGPDHINPDHVRWELHRVWVVEATLAAGKRHMMPRRRFYLQEDTWQALLSDGWDARQQLWHVGQVFPIIVPELPGVIGLTYAMYDLAKDGYAVSGLLNEGRRHVRVDVPKPDDYFSPDALAAEGVR